MKKQNKHFGGVWQEVGVWRYRFSYRGKRYFKSLPHVKTRTDAKAERDRHRLAVREGRDGAAASSTNFAAFVNETWMPWVRTNLAPSVHDNYEYRARHLVAEFGALDLSEITELGYERFKRQQLKRTTRRGTVQTPASVNRYGTVLGSIFSLAEELKLLPRGVRPRLKKLREENKRIRYLTVAEENALLSVAAEWPYLQDMIVVDCATGLRRNELFHLKKADVDLMLNVVMVTSGKGNKLRTIPLDPNSPVTTVLRRLLKTSRSEFVFTSPYQGDNFVRVDRSLAAACKLAGLEGVTFHVFRHTFITRLAAAGVDVRTIQELAGHASIQTTMRYMHLVESNARAAIMKLSEYRKAG